MMRNTSIAITFIPIVMLLFLPGCDGGIPRDEQRRLVDAYLAFWNSGRFDGIDEIMHPEYELRMSPTFEPEKGRDHFKESITRWRRAYPDFTLRIHDMVHDDSSAAARWTLTGTNTGPGSHPPTGKRIEVQGMSIVHFRDGKIIDEWIAGNDLLWIEQLGYVLIPPKEFQ